MNLEEKTFNNLAGLSLPNCVVREDLDKHIDTKLFKSIALAGAFPSGPPNNPTAISFVFNFLKNKLINLVNQMTF